MKTNFKNILGAALLLLAGLGATTTATAQTIDTRIVYSGAVTDRKTKQTTLQILSMDENGNNVMQLTSGSGGFPAWSYDKRYILFYSGDTIYIMEAIGELNGGRIFPVASNGGDSGVDWSPDARSIVFAGTPGILDGLWIMAVNPDTQELGTPTLVRPGLAAAPVWSPDGSKLAFVSYSGNPTITVRDLATGVENYVWPGYGPSFSPNGTKVTFSGAGPVTTTIKGKTTTKWYEEIFVANLDGTGLQQLTWLQTDIVEFPKWSQDMTRIAFRNKVSGVNSIYLLTLATGDVSLLKKGGTTLDWAAP